ncbi:unnamed protein product, partial [Polarella glacialis]
DLPRVYLSQHFCAGFGVDCEEFPAQAVRLEAGEAKAARAVRKEQRLQQGDLALRPLAERGELGVTPGEKFCDAEKYVEGTGSSRYLSELLSLACAPELLKLRLYPDAKELTESFAAFHAVRTHLSASFAPDDPAVTVVCVGDGSVPRTAALFAFRTRWTCYAVDPQMRRPGENWGGVERLIGMTAKIEDCKFEAEKLLIVCVHAHVGLAECLAVVEAKEALGIVAMPCCNYYNRLQMPDPMMPLAEYHDSGVVSPHRLVRIWSLDKGFSNE